MEQTKRTKCEIYTRVMWYFRPVSHFNIGKKAEHYNRIHFSEKKVIHLIPHTATHHVDCMNTEDDTTRLPW